MGEPARVGRIERGRRTGLRTGRRIGLLGGSFNPAHGGHLHISLLALKLLGLDEVWWLVSPQNPLKPTAGMAPFAARLEAARDATAGQRRIRVSDIERKLGTHYTADTLVALKRRYPRHRFVWLMGADNLAQIPAWQAWTRIFTELSIAVFDRPSYSFKALAGKAARRYAAYRVPPSRAKRLVGRKPPAWAFLYIPLHRASATAIRAKRGGARAGGSGSERGSSKRGRSKAAGVV
ncbi:MAG TPA: nicotinate-nucleotide adenylyltransferase [Alphaproteobacteria bacterium]|nr:nicotinate-nucleotide adenylyltransferase [Alphaproteobacteria bacterium]